MCKGCNVGLLLLDGSCTKTDVGHCRVSGNKLDGGGREWHLVLGAYGLQAANMRNRIGRRLCVVVANSGDSTFGEDSAIEHATQNDGDTTLLAERQEVVQWCLLKKGVTPGEQEAVEVHRAQSGHAGVDLVEANTNSSHNAFVAKPHKCGIGARHRFLESRRERGPVARDIEVMDPDWELVTAAAEIKARGGLSFADAFCVATAVRLQAPLWTGDPEIVELAGEAEIVDLR